MDNQQPSVHVRGQQHPVTSGNERRSAADVTGLRTATDGGPTSLITPAVMTTTDQVHGT